MSENYKELHFTHKGRTFDSFTSLVEGDEGRGVLLTLVNDVNGPIKAVHLLAEKGKNDKASVGQLGLYLVPAKSMQDLGKLIGEERVFEKGPHYNTTIRIRIPKDSVHAKFLDYETGTDEPVFNCKALTGVPEALNYLEHRHLITPEVVARAREFTQQVAAGLLYRDEVDMKRMLRGEKLESVKPGFIAREASRETGPSSPHIII